MDSNQGDGGASTQTANLTPDQAAEQLVTPEIQAKFDEVFQGKKAEAKPAPAGKAPATAGKPAPKADEAKRASTGDKRQRREEEAESLASLEGADEEDLAGEQFEDEGEGDEDAPSKKDDAAPNPKKEPIRPAAKAGKDEDGSDATPTLDPLLRQAAKRGGFTNEEIDELWEANPAVAEKTFEKLRGSFEDLGARYGQLGNQDPGNQHAQARQQRQAPAPRQRSQAAPDTTDVDEVLAQIYGDQLPAHAEKYGKDFVDDIVKPLVQSIRAPLEQVYRHYQQSQQEAMRAEVSQFFKGLDPVLQELYSDGKKATSEQRAAQAELFELADRIRTGARLQGEAMTVTEALELACMSHARGHLGKIERNKLVSSVRNRSKQITARPTQRKTPGRPSSSEAGSKGLDAAIEAYAARAADLGIDV